MRRKQYYFEREAASPVPLVYKTWRRARFGEVDAMAILWHGHYAVLFEEASTELRRHCGLSYEDFFREGLRAPIVQLHVDYHQPLVLDELFMIQASLVWSDAARLNTEYRIEKEAGSLAATGYTVQLFTRAENNEPWITLPPLLEQCREQWKNGSFKELMDARVHNGL